MKLEVAELENLCEYHLNHIKSFGQSIQQTVQYGEKRLDVVDEKCELIKYATRRIRELLKEIDAINHSEPVTVEE